MAMTRTVSLFVLLLFWGHRASAEEVGSRAWELYVSANYEGALSVLDTIEDAADSAGAYRTLKEYRALCLIAVDRLDDASSTIEQMIDVDPFYRPPVDQRPPRFIATFDHVRRHRLPALGRLEYANAIAAFNDHRYTRATESLALVLRLVEAAEDAGVDEGDRQNLAMLRTTAAESIENIRSYEQRLGSQMPRPREAFDGTDTDVIPPRPIRQEIPLWPAREPGAASFEGELELLIDAAGNVRDAQLTTTIHPTYDPMILAAARAWKYHPATKAGGPVSYRTVMTIRITPQRRIGPASSF